MNFPTNADRARRYRIATEIKSSTGKTTGWRAADLAFGDDVAIYELPPVLATDGEKIVEFARAGEVAHPGVVRWHSVDLTGGLAVREWVNGFTVRDLLRQRRKLPTAEAITLLSRLPAILDWLSTSGVARPDDLLSRTWAAFHPALSIAAVPSLPVSAWPPFQLKLSLLRPRDLRRKIDDAGSELTRSSEFESGSDCMDLARLLRELLGDRVRSGASTPLPPLNEKANDILRDTLHGKAWKSARGFWSAFVMAAAESHERAAESVEVFDFFVPAVGRQTPCRTIVLSPQEKACLPIRLCAGTEFRFGRDENVVDFPTILPLAENEVSGGISRGHARLEVRDGALWLRDGDGATASTNGTKWNEVPLSARSPIRMSGRGVLSLANRYRLALQPVVGEFAPVVSLGGKPVHFPKIPSLGAVVPMSIGDHTPMWRVAWIHTTLGFHLDAAGDLAWNLGGCIPPAGIFIREGDGFWLANVALPAQAVRVGDFQPGCGEAVPLLGGQSLRIGNRVYELATCG